MFARRFTRWRPARPTCGAWGSSDTGLSSCIRPSRRRIRWTTALPWLCAARSRTRLPAWGRTAVDTARSSSRWPMDGTPLESFSCPPLARHEIRCWPRGSGSTQSDHPRARAILFDISPRRLIEICGDALPARYVRALGRYAYGPGVFKIDYALDGPVPWRAEPCREAGTVHLGGTFEEIAAGELAVSRGAHPERPYVLVAQQSMIDSTRAPAGQHTLWAYCHVPNGSPVDMSSRIESQIERFAPGFSDLILTRATRGPAQVEAENPNYVGGDINGGLASLWQMFARPVASLCPYATPNPRIFICSASTPPGGGVHGMCGYHAARIALSELGITEYSPPGQPAAPQSQAR